MSHSNELRLERASLSGGLNSDHQPTSWLLEKDSPGRLIRILAFLPKAFAAALLGLKLIIGFAELCCWPSLYDLASIH